MAESVEQGQAPLLANAVRELELRGLNCACGHRLFPGWLNTDLARYTTEDGTETVPGRLALVNGCHYLEHDATVPFPIADESFEWVHCEHFIEHLTPGKAIRWLADIRRVLAPGGIVRISTPDLRKYIDGYLDPEQRFFEAEASRLDHMAKGMSRPLPFGHPQRALAEDYFPDEDGMPRRRAFMINQIFMFRYWDHHWIYDLDELRFVAARAGFEPDAVVEHEFRSGSVQEVWEIDSPGRRQPSIYVEITKAL
jgi:SAM-dependent methyltransferase